MELKDLPKFSPRYGPEWGSGGIFGLKYYKKTLYFTLAFEAESHFIDDNDLVYNFNLIGPAPRSGGDTYNASETVDNYIYFGGWVHAPAIFEGRKEKSAAAISFINKFSHVHYYDINERKVNLLWKDSIHNETDWAGEVSEIIYDPINDKLIIARGDGMKYLGIYSLDRNNGTELKISEKPSLKGSILYDFLCFDQISNENGFEGLQCYDMVERKITYYNVSSNNSADGWPLIKDKQYQGYVSIIGPTSSAYSRLFKFIKGGVYIGDPIGKNEPLMFYRLFDFGLGAYGPTRTNAIQFAGGVLIPFNSYTTGLIHPTNNNRFEEILSDATSTISSPSILLLILPPLIKIVGIAGGRITSIENLNSNVLLATNTEANLARYDANPIDIGYRSFLTLDSNSIIYSKPPSLNIYLKGKLVQDRPFGGIPLTDYKEAKIKIYASKENKLSIRAYNIFLSNNIDDQIKDENVFEIKMGSNIIDISQFKNMIVSFKLQNIDEKSYMMIMLNN